jgi:protease-4
VVAQVEFGQVHKIELDIGGLDDAIVKAASLAKIKNYSQNYQNMRKILMTFWLISFAKSKADFIKRNGVENYRILQEIKITNSKRCSSHHAFEINIH